MPGQILQVTFTAPDARIPRGHPCGAYSADGSAACGATPAEPYVKTCPHGHTRKIRLCGTHAAEAVTARASCRDCATDRTHPHPCPAGVHPLA